MKEYQIHMPEGQYMLYICSKTCTSYTLLSLKSISALSPGATVSKSEEKGKAISTTQDTLLEVLGQPRSSQDPYFLCPCLSHCSQSLCPPPGQTSSWSAPVWAHPSHLEERRERQKEKPKERECEREKKANRTLLSGTPLQPCMTDTDTNGSVPIRRGMLSRTHRAGRGSWCYFLSSFQMGLQAAVAEKENSLMKDLCSPAAPEREPHSKSEGGGLKWRRGIVFNCKTGMHLLKWFINYMQLIHYFQSTKDWSLQTLNTALNTCLLIAEWSFIKYNSFIIKECQAFIQHKVLFCLTKITNV